MKFRYKPVVVEAIRFSKENMYHVFEFCRNTYPMMHLGDGLSIKLYPYDPRKNVVAKNGDWIVKTADDRFYCYSHEDFTQIFEPVDEIGDYGY